MSPTNHPAETGGAASGIALLIAHAFGVNDPTTVVAIAVVIGFIPAGITWIVTLVRGDRTKPTD